VWVPKTRLPYATCVYSWITPPSRSRLMTLTSPGSASFSGPYGGLVTMRSMLSLGTATRGHRPALQPARWRAPPRPDGRSSGTPPRPGPLALEADRTPGTTPSRPDWRHCASPGTDRHPADAGTLWEVAAGADRTRTRMAEVQHGECCDCARRRLNVLNSLFGRRRPDRSGGSRMLGRRRRASSTGIGAESRGGMCLRCSGRGKQSGPGIVASPGGRMVPRDHDTRANRYGTAGEREHHLVRGIDVHKVQEEPGLS
jgi:hypothetical protein